VGRNWGGALARSAARAVRCRKTGEASSLRGDRVQRRETRRRKGGPARVTATESLEQCWRLATPPCAGLPPTRRTKRAGTGGAGEARAGSGLRWEEAGGDPKDAGRPSVDNNPQKSTHPMSLRLRRPRTAAVCGAMPAQADPHPPGPGEMSPRALQGFAGGVAIGAQHPCAAAALSGLSVRSLWRSRRPPRSTAAPACWSQQLGVASATAAARCAEIPPRNPGRSGVAHQCDGDAAENVAEMPGPRASSRAGIQCVRGVCGSGRAPRRRRGAKVAGHAPPPVAKSTVRARGIGRRPLHRAPAYNRV